MAESPSTATSIESPHAIKRAWSAPTLVGHGHIGKLTQGSSGTKTDTSNLRP